MLRDTIDQLELRSDLVHALDRGELFLQYQPVVELAGERIIGVEALLRWRHPIRGVVAPLDFIPAAEATGLIIDIGRWVLHTACRQARVWQLANPEFADLRLSVNLSPRQLAEDCILDDVRTALSLSGLPAQSLVLEITESVLMTDTAGSVDVLHRLRGLGVSIAVDDFGTGYSSLSYLRTFPLDGLKIDKSFVCDISEEHEQAALMSAILGLADGLNLWTVAEGIEEPYQAEWLRSLGCTYGQGYLFFRPLDATAIDELVAVADPSPALAAVVAAI